VSLYQVVVDLLRQFVVLLEDLLLKFHLLL
jgi:hypothetical protein